MDSDLRQLKKEIKREVNKRVKESAQAIAADAKLRAPVRTGLLKRSIRARRVAQAHWLVDCGEAWYALFPEYGTHNMAPQPFLTPAAEREAAHLERRFEDLA